jgi:hypothetical protein
MTDDGDDSMKKKDVWTTLEEMRKVFSNNKSTLRALDAFLQAKESYTMKDTVDNCIAMQTAYVDIYEDIKVAWYAGKYNEPTFRRYVEALKTFDDEEDV